MRGAQAWAGPPGATVDQDKLRFWCILTSRPGQDYASLCSRKEDWWATSPRVAGAERGDESPTPQLTRNLSPVVHSMKACNVAREQVQGGLWELPPTMVLPWAFSSGKQDITAT